MKTSGARKLYTIPLPSLLVYKIRDASTKSVLDVGCGYGRACYYLYQNSFNVVGVDVDRVQIGLAQQESKSRGIAGEMGFLANDARNLSFPDSCFDAATMLGILTLVPKSERLRIVIEVSRVVKKDGYILVEEFGRTWENPVYAKRYRQDFKVTGELGTITVKNETGKILHFGHHFTLKELLDLFKDFRVIDFRKGTFTSYYHKNWVKGYTILTQKQKGQNPVR